MMQPEEAQTMDRIELGKALNLTEESIATGRDNRPGIIIKPTSITIHNTDNSAPGANANAHSRFVRDTGYYLHNGKKRQVSWHFTVDDLQVIKQLPLNELAFHAEAGNRSSLAIEICMNAGIDQAAANERAAKLVAALLYDLRLDVSGIKTHKDWTGKNCPSLLLSGLPAFKARVKTILDGLAGPRAGLEFDAADLGLATDTDARLLFPLSSFADEKADEADIDHEELARAIDREDVSLQLLPSGEERIKKALQLVKEARTYEQGCSEFICEVLGISWEDANSLMGPTPKKLDQRPPYSDLSKGDIVGWKSTGSGHVAIYYGKSDDEFFIDVQGPRKKPRIKNGYYDQMLYKSSR